MVKVRNGAGGSGQNLECNVRPAAGRYDGALIELVGVAAIHQCLRCVFTVSMLRYLVLGIRAVDIRIRLVLVCLGKMTRFCSEPPEIRVLSPSIKCGLILGLRGVALWHRLPAAPLVQGTTVTEATPRTTIVAVGLL